MPHRVVDIEPLLRLRLDELAVNQQLGRLVVQQRESEKEEKWTPKKQPLAATAAATEQQWLTMANNGQLHRTGIADEYMRAAGRTTLATRNISLDLHEKMASGRFKGRVFIIA